MQESEKNIEANRLTSRHIARILSGIGELSVAQKEFLKSNIRWLTKDIIELFEGAKENDDEYSRTR